MNAERMDAAFGPTPAGVTRRLRAALEACPQRVPARPRLCLRTAAIVLAALLALGGIALAVGQYGMRWWMDNRWGYIRESFPQLYQRIGNHLQTDIEQTHTPCGLTLAVRDAAWLDDGAFFAIEIACDNPAYELHPLHNLDVDGAFAPDMLGVDPEARAEHWLWTAHAFGPPEQVMAHPERALLLYADEGLTLATPDGMPLLGGWDCVLGEQGQVLIAIECSADYFMREETQAALAQATDAGGFITLCYRFRTEAYAPDASRPWPVIDTGVLTFRVKAR